MILIPTAKGHQQGAIQSVGSVRPRVARANAGQARLPVLFVSCEVINNIAENGFFIKRKKGKCINEQDVSRDHSDGNETCPLNHGGQQNVSINFYVCSGDGQPVTP
jgi:hypothetical protein